MVKVALPPSRTAPQFVVRLPSEEVRERIAKTAAENGRSMNAEIVSMIEAALSNQEELHKLRAAVAGSEARLQNYVKMLDQMGQLAAKKDVELARLGEVAKQASNWMPAGLRAKVEEAAKSAGRDVRDELVFRLEASFAPTINDAGDKILGVLPMLLAFQLRYLIDLLAKLGMENEQVVQRASQLADAVIHHHGSGLANAVTEALNLDIEPGRVGEHSRVPTPSREDPFAATLIDAKTAGELRSKWLIAAAASAMESGVRNEDTIALAKRVAHVITMRGLSEGEKEKLTALLADLRSLPVRALSPPSTDTSAKKATRRR